MENRVATAVVVATLLSSMATIYIAVAIASSHWLSFMPNNQSTPPGNHLGNHSPAPGNMLGNKSSLSSTDRPTSAGCWGDGEGHCLRQLALLGGHIGLWKVCCIIIPNENHKIVYKHLLDFFFNFTYFIRKSIQIKF
uniref:Uncharacterized protein n=1 Tax=Eptatretus burgeri TaxID=7764 RepID=A0A8C4Q6C1_EPTBU